MPTKQLTIEDNERLLTYCKNHFDLKEVKDLVDNEKDFVRDIVLKMGEANPKNESKKLKLEGYTIMVSPTTKTSLADDFVIKVKAMPEIMHTVIHSLQVPYNELKIYAKEIAKGRLGIDPNDADVDLVLKELSERYLIGTGVDEDGLTKAIENQIVSADKAQELFKETKGTPTIRVSKSK